MKKNKIEKKEIKNQEIYDKFRKSKDSNFLEFLRKLFKENRNEKK